LACLWLLVAPLEETVKSDRREFPKEMRSTLDRLWKRGTLPQRAGQSPQPARVFGFWPVICFYCGQRCGGAEPGAVTFMICGPPVAGSRRTAVRRLWT
jgi:hypothetical protein